MNSATRLSVYRVVSLSKCHEPDTHDLHVADIFARMSRGCYEEIASVKFKLYAIYGATRRPNNVYTEFDEFVARRK